MKTPYLKTERLILRNFCPADLDALFDYRNDERCTRFQRGQLHDREDLSALIQRRKDDDLLSETKKQLAIADQATGQFVGEVTIFLDDPETILMGYTISYHHHRKGYAFEMLSAILEILHETYPQKEFVCYVEPENIASMELLKKLGFTELGWNEEEQACVFGKWN